MIHWLASFPKSGSTWARAVLEAYRTGRLDINNMSTCFSDNFPYFYDSLSPARNLTEAERRLIRPAALLHLTKFPIAKPLVVKTHNANVVIEDIPLIPNAVTENAVYIVRDPRDVVLSYARHFNSSIDEAIEAMGDRNRSIGEDGMEHVTADWSFHVKSWACEKKFKVLVVKYEQMLSDPVRAFGSMLAYFCLEVDQERLKKAIKDASIDQLRKQEKDNGFQEKKGGESFFVSGTTGQWKSVLTEEQARKIEAQHAEVMNEFGYTESCRDNRRSGRHTSCGIGTSAIVCAS